MSDFCLWMSTYCVCLSGSELPHTTWFKVHMIYLYYFWAYMIRTLSYYRDADTFAFNEALIYNRWTIQSPYDVHQLRNRYWNSRTTWLLSALKIKVMIFTETMLDLEIMLWVRWSRSRKKSCACSISNRGSYFEFKYKLSIFEFVLISVDVKKKESNHRYPSELIWDRIMQHGIWNLRYIVEGMKN